VVIVWLDDVELTTGLFQAVQENNELAVEMATHASSLLETIVRKSDGMTPETADQCQQEVADLCAYVV
jgi:hypothetical protein